MVNTHKRLASTPAQVHQKWRSVLLICLVPILLTWAWLCMADAPRSRYPNSLEKLPNTGKFAIQTSPDWGFSNKRSHRWLGDYANPYQRIVADCENRELTTLNGPAAKQFDQRQQFLSSGNWLLNTLQPNRDQDPQNYVCKVSPTPKKSESAFQTSRFLFPAWARLVANRFAVGFDDQDIFVRDLHQPNAPLKAYPFPWKTASTRTFATPIKNWPGFFRTRPVEPNEPPNQPQPNPHCLVELFKLDDAGIPKLVASWKILAVDEYRNLACVDQHILSVSPNGSQIEVRNIQSGGIEKIDLPAEALNWSSISWWDEGKIASICNKAINQRWFWSFQTRSWLPTISGSESFAGLSADGKLMLLSIHSRSGKDYWLCNAQSGQPVFEFHDYGRVEFSGPQSVVTISDRCGYTFTTRSIPSGKIEMWRPLLPSAWVLFASLILFLGWAVAWCRFGGFQSNGVWLNYVLVIGCPFAAGAIGLGSRSILIETRDPEWQLLAGAIATSFLVAMTWLIGSSQALVLRLLPLLFVFASSTLAVSNLALIWLAQSPTFSNAFWQVPPILSGFVAGCFIATATQRRFGFSLRHGSDTESKFPNPPATIQQLLLLLTAIAIFIVSAKPLISAAPSIWFPAKATSFGFILAIALCFVWRIGMSPQDWCKMGTRVVLAAIGLFIITDMAFEFAGGEFDRNPCVTFFSWKPVPTAAVHATRFCVAACFTTLIAAVVFRCSGWKWQRLPILADSKNA